MTPHPLRLQRKRTKGFRLPPGTVVATRPTMLGNPFTHPDPAQAVEAYRRLIQGGTQSFEIQPGGLGIARNANPKTLHWSYPDWIKENLPGLRGRRMACFCGLSQPCHVDVLLEKANG
ncbi:MAG: DUF4326 domain-containing protein [Roseomonas mucosa]|nr:DUF4326 domain-containing protein [Roseomonas mucosa]